MDDKDTFHTFGYRGGYIHTCWNRTRKKEEVQVQRYEGDKARAVKSVIGAKRLIGRYLAKKESKS
jgi:hypothetical protein